MLWAGGDQKVWFYGHYDNTYKDFVYYNISKCDCYKVIYK